MVIFNLDAHLKVDWLSLQPVSMNVMQNDDKAVVRLKRYITMCGAWRNYKKLLDGCRSVRSQVAVLKKELEDLGVHG